MLSFPPLFIAFRPPEEEDEEDDEHVGYVDEAAIRLIHNSTPDGSQGRCWRSVPRQSYVRVCRHRR